MPPNDPIARSATPLSMGEDSTVGAVYKLPAWNGWSDAGKVRFLRRLSEQYGAEPRMRYFTTQVFQRYGAAPRDYQAQCAAILKYAQSEIYYVNESDEQIQSPWRTIKERAGDCDDLNVLICSMAQSVGLGWRIALAGFRDEDPTRKPETRAMALRCKAVANDPARSSEERARAAQALGALSKVRVRWIEGQPHKAASYVHVYPVLGWPALSPTTWASAEPTIPVPLGHDVVLHGIPSGTRGGKDLAGFAGAGAFAGAAAFGAPDVIESSHITRPGDLSQAVTGAAGVQSTFVANLVNGIDFYALLNSVVQGVGTAVAIAWVSKRLHVRL